MKQLISIVAPMYNEEKLAHKYCEETLKMLAPLKSKYDIELLLVNDGSKDSTYQIMKEERKLNPKEISVVCLSRNFGLEGAVNAGIRKAKGDAVVVMDADLQDPPSLIVDMVSKWEDGADVVVASRIKRSNDNFFKKAGANFYYKILGFLSGKLKLEKSAANFRLLSRKAVNQILDLPEVNSVFRVVVPFIGMKTAVVEYDRDKRYAGTTKYNLKSMIPYALDSITGISVEPLRKFMYFLPLIFLLFLFSFVALFLAPTEWKPALLVIVAMYLGIGIVFAILVVVAEYIAQIMIEVKGRPVSIIYEYEPSDNAEQRE